MKYLLIISLFLFLGCKFPKSESTCLSKVQEDFPNYTVIDLPNSNYEYLLLDSLGNLFYISVSSSCFVYPRVMLNK